MQQESQNSELRNQQIWLAVGSLMVIAAAVLAAGLFYTRVVMIPFVLAIFITAAVAPMVDLQIVRWRIAGLAGGADDGLVCVRGARATECAADSGGAGDGSGGHGI